MKFRKVSFSTVFDKKVDQNGISANYSNSKYYCYDISKGYKKLFYLK